MAYRMPFFHTLFWNSGINFGIRTERFTITVFQSREKISGNLTLYFLVKIFLKEETSLQHQTARVISSCSIAISAHAVPSSYYTLLDLE